MGSHVQSLIEVDRNFKEFISNLWGNKKPLCMLFSTNMNNYLYDTGTNRIFCCAEHEHELLESILTLDLSSGVEKFTTTHSKGDAHRAFTSLKECIEKMNILKLTQVDSFGMPQNNDFIFDQIQNNLGMLFLELTQSCNLRCGYCIYNDFWREKRNYSNINMTDEIATKAIAYFKEHTKKNDNLALGFYGGEPLLQYTLLKKVVCQAKELINNKRLRFSITTNGTLINADIADYLYKENFSVLISLDGPMDIHDLWRRDLKNKGSFVHTLNGLRILNDAFEGDASKLGLSMVYAPPYSDEKIERIADFITSISWLPQDISIVITYPQEGTVTKGLIKNHENMVFDYSLINWARKRFFNDFRRNFRSHPIAKGIFEKKLAKLVQREVNDTPKRIAPLNGCCIPGARKNYVTATGDIEVCERIGMAPRIGNIDNGINFEVIKKYYIDEYAEKSISRCSTCWLIRMCPICYQQAFYNNEIDISKKDMFCFMYKNDGKQTLIDYCSLTEINDKGLDYLSEFVIS